MGTARALQDAELNPLVAVTPPPTVMIEPVPTCGRCQLPTLPPVDEGWPVRWGAVGNRHAGEVQVILFRVPAVSGCLAVGKGLS